MPSPESGAEDLAPRRVPVQERSRERVEAILDAAGAIVVEDGLDGLTTEAVARRAGIAIGSLYQFFPNKHAILNSLALRSLDDLDLDALSAELRTLPFAARTDRMVDALAMSWRADRVGDIVWSAMQVTPEMRAAAAAYRQTLAERLTAALWGPRARAPQRRAGRVILETIRGVLDLWLREGATESALLDELKEMVRNYAITVGGRTGK